MSKSRAQLEKLNSELQQKIIEMEFFNKRLVESIEKENSKSLWTKIKEHFFPARRS